MSNYKLSQRAKQIVKKNGIQCNCSGIDDDQPHKRWCALTLAFNEAWEQAEAEYSDHCDQLADERRGK